MEPREAERTHKEEPVWRFRGYELGPGNFTTAMVHLYRAQIARADAWRMRLDATTNWAVITTGVALPITFTAGKAGHVVVIMCTMLVTLFLWIEARRYRYYELWSTRVRLMETDFFASMLVPPFQPRPDWDESLARSLLQPQFPITVWEALGRRFRYNYVWVYIVLGLAWLIHVTAFPEPAASVEEVLRRASVAGLPGWLVLAAGIVFNGALLALGLMTLPLAEAPGEVLHPWPESLQRVELPPPQGRPWFRPRSQTRRRVVILVVSRRSQAIGARILQEMKRGATLLPATGLYTGTEVPVLLCAVTVTEREHLQRLVREEDPEALIMAFPAAQVTGPGFPAPDKGK